MPKTSNINMRIDPEIKAQADGLFKKLGTSTSEAINMFLHKALIYGGIPFEIALNVPNEITLEAIKEAEEMRNDPHRKTYASADELFEDLNNEIDR